MYSKITMAGQGHHRPSSKPVLTFFILVFFFLFFDLKLPMPWLTL